MTAPISFKVLGPLEASRDGTQLNLGPHKQRTLLAFMLINANRLVSTDRILEALWGPDGVSKENALWIYISRLRTALEPDREGRGESSIIVRREPGYELVVDHDHLDSSRFEEMLAEASSLTSDDPKAAISLLDEALSLWRGEPIADFVYESFAREEIDRLTELRVQAEEVRVSAGLKLGQSNELIAPLEALAAAYPYRERPIGQLMVALYRSGRQSEALRAFDRHRRTIGEELGIEPGPELTRLQEQILLHDSAIAAAPDQSVSLTSSRNPYKGLRPFDESDGDDFHGRDSLTADVLNRLERGDGLVALVGPSGSGKSSLVLAGVIPKLRKGSLDDSDLWQVATMTPGPFPLTELETALLRSTIDPPDSLADQLAGDEDDRILRAALRVMGHDVPRLVLVIDQFEELFTRVEDTELQRSFLRGLLAAIDDRRLSVILTLRADMYDKPLTLPEFAALLGPSVVNVTPMTAEELEDAAVIPAAETGLTFEPSLLAQLLSDVVNQPGGLPMFQYTLTELYHRTSESILRASDYQAMGGVSGAITTRADELYAALDPDEQEAARQLFLRLTTTSDDGATSRRRVPASDITSLDVDVVALQSVIGQFGDARLLSFDKDPSTGAPTVEVAHEALLTQWRRLATWISKTQDDLLVHRSLAAAVHEWTTSDRQSDYLAVGTRLADYEGLLARRAIGLNAPETEFIAASRAATDDAERKEQARRQEQKAMERLSRRRLLLGFAGAAAAIAVGVVAAFAFVQWNRANNLASAQERVGLARSLAAASLANLDSGDAELSLLLAIEAAEVSLEAGEEVLPEVVDALHRAIVNPRPDLIIDGANADRDANVIAFGPDGSTLVMAAKDGGAAIVGPVTGETLARIPAIESRAFGVAFNPNGEQIITMHSDGVRQWSWRTATLDNEFLPPFELRTARFSFDGSQLAMGGEDGTVRVLDSASGRVVNEWSAHTGPVTALDFGTSGFRLATGGIDQRVLIWNIESLDFVEANPTNVVSAIEDLAWHPTIQAIAVTTEQGDAFLVDAGTGERMNSFGNSQDQHRALAVDPLGIFVMGVGTDGFTQIYIAVNGGEAFVTLATGGVSLRDAAFDPGSLLAVATVGIDGKVRIWRDLLSSELTPEISTNIFPTIDATPDGSRYLVGSTLLSLGVRPTEPTTVEVFDGATNERVFVRHTWKTDNAWATAAISDDGERLALQAKPGGLEIIDMSTQAAVRIPDSAGEITFLEFNRDGTVLGAGWLDGRISLYDTTSGEVIAVLLGHGDRLPLSRTSRSVTESRWVSNERVDEFVFTGDGTEILSVGFDGTLRRWDVATGTNQVVHHFEYEATTVALSPDGTRFVAADRTGVSLMFDTTSEETLFSLDSVFAGVGLVFSPDGSKLAGSSTNGNYLWNAETGALEREFIGDDFWSTGIAFINDGRQLVTAGGTGITRWYHVYAEDLVALARDETSRELTEAECERYLGRSCET